MTRSEPMPGYVPAPAQTEGAAPKIVYPSWMDGRYMMATSAVMGPNRLTLDASGRGVIPGNAQRWCLILASGLMAGAIDYAPFGDPGAVDWWTTTNGGGAVRLAIFEWGPIACGPIVCAGAVGAVVEWTEIVTY